MPRNYINKRNKYKFTKLKPIDHLRNLRLLTEDRKRWSILIKYIYDAAKAEKDF